MQVAHADTPYRIAQFHAPLSRDGPGLLLADILSEDEQVLAIASTIAHVDPDVIALTDFDYDHEAVALTAFSDLLARLGSQYPHAYAPLPNAGQPSGLDIDGDGRFGEPEDAVGYGRFWGDGSVAVLSKWPIDAAGIGDLSGIKWANLEGNRSDGLPEGIRQLPVSSSAHIIVPIDAPQGPFNLLVSAATAPVFDGPEDRNGRRNADELLLWQTHLEGAKERYVLAINANLDPYDGEGLHDAMTGFLASGLTQDPNPTSLGDIAAADPDHRGPPELDTVDWPDGRPGNLRVGYVLPDPDWRVEAAGVFWPDPSEPNANLLGADGLAAGPHRLVWVDLRP